MGREHEKRIAATAEPTNRPSEATSGWHERPTTPTGRALYVTRGSVSGEDRVHRMQSNMDTPRKYGCIRIYPWTMSFPFSSQSEVSRGLGRIIHTHVHQENTSP